MCMREGTCATVSMPVKEYSLEDLVLSFPLWIPGIEFGSSGLMTRATTQ